MDSLKKISNLNLIVEFLELERIKLQNNYNLKTSELLSNIEEQNEIISFNEKNLNKLCEDYFYGKTKLTKVEFANLSNDFELKIEIANNALTKLKSELNLVTKKYNSKLNKINKTINAKQKEINKLKNKLSNEKAVE